MAFFYVKDDGVATGDAGRYATKQLGSFATLGTANYYASSAAANAATTPPVAGDFVFISDTHDYTQGSTMTFLTGVYYICVSDLNIDQTRRSGFKAKEETTATNADFNINGAIISGVDLVSLDDINIAGGSVVTLMEDSVLNILGANDAIFLNNAGCGLNISHSEIILTATSSKITLFNGASFYMSHTIVSTPSAGINELFGAGFNGGGGEIKIQECDLTGVTGTLIANSGNDPLNEDVIDVEFSRCKLATGVAFTNEEFKSYNQRLIASQCSDSDITAEYQYHIHTFGGDLNEDTSVYRNEDEAFPISNQKISYKIETNADASEAFPFWFEFPSVKGIELSNAASDTISVFVTSDTVLTDKDIYVSVSYPDGTNYADNNNIKTCPVTVGNTYDYLATATTLTTDATSTWTNGLINKYEIQVDTSSLPGSDSVPAIKVFVTLPSTTIHINSETVES